MSPHLLVGPDVVPLQVNGGVDTDQTNITDTEVMLYGLSNLWKEDQEGGYTVRYSRRPANDFGRPRKGEERPYNPNAPNFWERAYPCLYPYGRGGIEADRESPLSFIEQVRWSLEHHDGRFRRHENFPFLAFGIEQRRQALNSARIQMRRRDFDRDSGILSGITQDSLREAVRQEELGQTIHDPAVRLLRRHLHAAGARVQGSDASRYQLRSKIWSTSVAMGPPSVWITINPSDLHNPIAQVFAGEQIDLDAFVSTEGPDKNQRAKNIAQDPWAASKFFHFIIDTILATLFQVKVTGGHRVESGMGIFGRICAYFGTVEAQGRGTLHLHALLYSQHTPSPSELLELLKTESFRSKVADFIRANVRAYLPGLESETSVASIPNEREIGYNRPPNPDEPSYVEQLGALELRVARSKQVHKCERRRCLVPDQNGVYVCKRGVPFECSPDEYVKENGEWCPKRLYSHVNGWNPAITVNLMCNNDCKIITNGHDTKNLTWYITGYAAKKQNKTHNLSAIMAKGHAYHQERSDYNDSLQDDQRKLILRVVQSVNRQQELSGPMVIAYLMGWKDTKESHHYSPLFWSSFSGALLRTFPSLRRNHARTEYVMSFPYSSCTHRCLGSPRHRSRRKPGNSKQHKNGLRTG